MGNVSTFSTVVEDDRGFVEGRGVVVDRVDELDRVSELELDVTVMAVLELCQHY